MAVPKTTTWPLEPHTKTKHLILGKYLAAWLPIMSSRNGRIVFIDGFAGPGRYSKGEEGSPLIALRTALEHNGLSPECECNFLFIEADERRAEHLRGEIEQLRAERPFPKRFNYEVAHAKFEEKISALLSELSAKRLAPTLAFIDPFGFEGLPMKLVAEIARHPKCECLITFMYEPVNRFFEHPNPKIQEHLEELFGATEACGLLELSEVPEERFRKITSLYEGQLRAVAKFKFVRTFTMINVGNRVEYLLFFGTNSETGLSRMKAAMWKADPGDGCRFSDRTVSSQEVLLGPEPDLALLERLLRDRFRGKGFVDISEIERFVVVDTPFLDTHIRMKTLAPMERTIPPRIEAHRAPGTKKCVYPAGTKVRFL
jgi:three-Cys-motif partner protein